MRKGGDYAAHHESQATLHWGPPWARLSGTEQGQQGRQQHGHGGEAVGRHGHRAGGLIGVVSAMAGASFDESPVRFEIHLLRGDRPLQVVGDAGDVYRVGASGISDHSKLPDFIM